jgi:hypothetical protein
MPRVKVIYYGVIALLGVFLIFVWRTCTFGMRMEILDQHTACAGNTREAAPIDFEKVEQE